MINNEQDRQLMKKFFSEYSNWMLENSLNDIENLDKFKKMLAKYMKNLNQGENNEVKKLQIILNMEILKLKNKELANKEIIGIDIESLIEKSLKSMSQLQTDNEVILSYIEELNVIKQISEISRLVLNESISKKIKQNRIEENKSKENFNWNQKC